MSRRGIETALAYFTLALLAIYIPVETWVSLPAGLLDPYYLVDAIAMALLLWGAVHSLRSRPRPSPELLCIGAAWASANGWRATFARLREVQAGGTLTYGSVEMWTVGIATALGICVFAALLVLVALNRRRGGNVP
jgi:hypothetical protein